VADAQLHDPSPSTTVTSGGLDVLQFAAAAVAGEDRVVVIVGPPGPGKTTTLEAAVTDMNRQHRSVFGVAPTAKAAKVLGQETGMHTDTVAKLLHEWAKPDGPGPQWRLPSTTTVIVDEAGMLSTPELPSRQLLVVEPCLRFAFEIEVRLTADVDCDAMDGATGEPPGLAAGVVVGDRVTAVASDAQSLAGDHVPAGLKLERTFPDLRVAMPERQRPVRNARRIFASLLERRRQDEVLAGRYVDGADDHLFEHADEVVDVMEPVVLDVERISSEARTL
jgi:hypothetical protein